jgi:hypothetical protein
MFRKFMSVLFVLIVAFSAAAPAYASGKSADTPPGGGTRIFGVVWARGQASSHLSSGAGNLSYHNGPVMHTNTTYAIYWVPAGYTVSANYVSLINGFFQNVAADSGKTSNVYYATTQYYDNTNGHILYSSSFGGFVVDTDPLPASGCSDSYTTVCLSDAQIQAEIDKVATAQGWSRSGNEFFMLTAKGIGSCAGSSCAFSQYCAYHSNFAATAGDTLYANMPYADTVPAACDAGQRPNNDDADPEINVISHEHNETITDMHGNAWYDKRGYEDGDKCAWNFGTALGSTGSTGSASNSEYNQVIGTGKYYLQQEWSNKSSKCVLTGL